jgi:hypothetical protein
VQVSNLPGVSAWSGAYGHVSSIKWVPSESRYLALEEVFLDKTHRCIMYQWSDTNSITSWTPDSHPLLPNSSTCSTSAGYNYPDLWTAGTNNDLGKEYYSMIDPSTTDVNFDTIHDPGGTSCPTSDLYYVAIHPRITNDGVGIPDWGKRDLYYYHQGLQIHTAGRTC